MAGILILDGDRALVDNAPTVLAANSVHALLGHGVIDELNGLALEGTLGAELEVVVPPPLLDEVRAILYRADRKTYGARFEFAIGRREGPNPVEYRLRIENREYQRTLARLVDVATRASRAGHAMWMRI